MKYCSTVFGNELYIFDDPFHPMLTEFRKAVCADHNCPVSMMLTNETHKQMRTYYEVNNIDGDFEEAYKVCNAKWATIPFDNIVGVVVDGKVVSISGTQYYNNHTLLRTCMSLYTLFEYRKVVRSVMFADGGFFEQHVAYGKSTGADAVFISVYQHSKKLKYHAKNLGKRKYSTDRSRIISEYLDNLEECGEVILNNVPQSIFVYSLNKDYQFNGIY